MNQDTACLVGSIIREEMTIVDAKYINARLNITNNLNTSARILSDFHTRM
jgi:hypothetical protein